ncbi:helix-turn-helix domain-containing protein [Malikia spinosa]|jgi:hypothetical protein|uniref:helix-turn-helix domain-containing protein n=1 Tax=Malikia spinosa TaxID=86180 RepID=UPI003FA1D20D
MEKCSAEDKVSQGDDDDLLARASLAAKQAKTLDELRRSLVVTLTLKHKLTIQETAQAIGRSTSWVYAARAAYISGEQIPSRGTHGGRRNQILKAAEEEGFMEDVCIQFLRLILKQRKDLSFTGDEAQIHEVAREALEERTGRSIPKSTVFGLMARVGRRKFPSPYYPRQWTIHAYRIWRS